MFPLANRKLTKGETKFKQSLKVCEEKITESPTQENFANLSSVIKSKHDREYGCRHLSNLIQFVHLN